ncbi:class I SAM-dependent methyltransferase [Patescibacteria group bacterium]
MTSLLNKTAINKLITHYDGVGEWHNFNEKENNIGYGLIHYSIVRNQKPKKVLSIGSKKGFIPACIALACRENGVGKVDFVDAGFGEPNKQSLWGGVGFWKNNDPKKHFSTLNLSKHISFHLLTTEKFSDEFPKKRWDYIYVDGDHSYKGIKKDYKLFWPKLNTNGYMLFHDINPDKSHPDLEKETKRFWDELSEKHNSIVFPGNWGLGLIQKTTKNTSWLGLLNPYS